MRDLVPGRRTLLLTGLGGLLAGCGFHPVYQGTGGGPGPSRDLAAIDVKPIYERPGQILRDTLIARMEADTGVPRRYDLRVNFWITGEGQAVLDFTQPTRLRLVGYANWALTARDTARTKLLDGNDRVLDGFDIFDSQLFAADLDNEHVQRRVAMAMADRIVARLAAWFHAHPTAAG